jgi:uncharacterized protein YdeI (BOF family)
MLSENSFEREQPPPIFFPMKKLSLLGLTLLCPLASSHASSPSAPRQITPVSWIVQTQHNINVDDKRVTLVGEVIRRDDGSDWWFSDTTGSVRLDTGDKELPVGRMLFVTGHIDQARFGIGHLEVEVNRWSYANRG